MGMAINIIKLVGGIGAGICGSQTAEIILKNITPETVKTSEKVMVGIGTAIFTGIAANMATQYVHDTVDEIGDFVEGMKS